MEAEFFKDLYILKTKDVRKVKIDIYLILHYKVSLCAKFLAANVCNS